MTCLTIQRLNKEVKYEPKYPDFNSENGYSPPMPPTQNELESTLLEIT